ncbi:hypothetical protein STCU_07816 [Strigomonas culicis]|uniref:CYTH domain-containing protein n=1 Tax=Strigomonas culicis TaxID=28005 RepID=S9VJ36_9TRYP|nr:hypothetical protein STCU_07816 [Strigomonas culicis]|eukprot:EPY23215.1 hypothetical protein STCU_07816 [Strigomonas culicis]
MFSSRSVIFFFIYRCTYFSVLTVLVDYLPTYFLVSIHTKQKKKHSTTVERMPLEIKMVLNDVSDYTKLVGTLEHLFLSEQSYCDYFFDFACNALSEQKSVLRLRVPCVKPDSVSSPLVPQQSGLVAAAEPVAADAPAMDPAYMAFLRSLSAPPAPGSSRGVGGAAAGGGGGPAPELLPGACGKLVFKQKNTIDRGEQMSFLLEEKELPAAVVQQLLAGVTPVFEVLEAYADAQRAGGNADCKVLQLLDSLREVARQYVQDPRSPASAAADADSENYTQLRYASGGLSPSDGTSGSRPTDGARSRSVEEMCRELGRIGSYMTTRKMYHFIRLAEDERARLTPAELQVRESLRLQVDRTLFPFGEGYELEVPRIDLPLDDIMLELRAFLQSCGIRYYPGAEGKFAQYMRMKRNADAETHDVQDVKMRITNIYGYQEVRNNLERIVAERRKASESGRLRANADASFPADAAEDTETYFTEELHENFFFDSPTGELRSRRCFLRLRHYEQSKRYTLVLKENQTVVDGQQENRSCKTELSEVSAQQLRDDPTHFLQTQWQHNAVTQALWSFFNLRALIQLPAHFRTYRITVPWWSAQSQRPTVQRHGGPALQRHAAPGPDSADGVSPAHFLSQQQHSAVPLVPPLSIHLDRTQYELPPTARQPFSLPTATQQSVHVDHETGNRIVELYEMEITNIVPQTSPLAVLKELSAVLESLGVECSKGIQSKLEQYFSLL